MDNFQLLKFTFIFYVVNKCILFWPFTNNRTQRNLEKGLDTIAEHSEWVKLGIQAINGLEQATKGNISVKVNYASTIQANLCFFGLVV